MILDSFKLHNAIIQIQYADAYELWDRAGAIARKLCSIWGELKVVEGKPQQQVLRGKGVFIHTGFTQSTMTLTGVKPLDEKNIHQAKETLDVWRKELELIDLQRVSTRTTYLREFPSLRDANAQLLALKLANWPDTKVFDQPTDSESNGVEIRYRFEDETSFSVLTIKVEKVQYEADLDPYFVENAQIRETRNRLLIDFDRGLLGSVNAEKFRVDEWIRGYQHILRRDIEKVTKG